MWVVLCNGVMVARRVRCRANACGVPGLTRGHFLLSETSRPLVATKGRHGTGRGALEPRFLHAGRVLPMADRRVWFLSAGGLERVP